MASPIPLDPDSPEVLVRDAARGDLGAFARIVRLHHEAMTRTALLVTGDLALATEAVASTWPVAWPRLGDLDDPGRLGPWLGSLAVDEAVFLVTRGRTRELSRVVTAWEPRDAALARDLDRLSPADRALLARHHLAGLEPDELARRPTRSPRRVRARLARLAAAVAAPLPGAASADDVAASARAILRAHVDVRVLPVNADDAARRAGTEAALERGRLVSVAVCTVVGILVAAAPYLVPLAYRH